MSLKLAPPSRTRRWHIQRMSPQLHGVSTNCSDDRLRSIYKVDKEKPQQTCKGCNRNRWGNWLFFYSSMASLVENTHHKADATLLKRPAERAVADQPISGSSQP